MKKILFFILVALPSAATVFAQPQQSENFRITKSVLDAGGGVCASTNFRLESAFGQPSPVGVQSSANFSLSGGFLSPSFAVSPLSPIQQLVIQVLAPDARLAWPRVTGAAQYKIYRSTDPLFTPGPTTLLGSAGDTSYVDANIVGLPAIKNFYIVTAVSGSGALLTVQNPTQPDSKSNAAVSASAMQTKPSHAAQIPKK